MKKKNAKIAKSLRARFVILNLSLRRFGRSDPDLASGSKDGVSLIIAIIFVSAFMLVMAGLFEARLRVIQAVGNREQEAKARYLAESAAELASYAAATHGAGWNLAEIGDEAEALESYIWEAARNLGISSCGAAVPGAATAMTPCSRVQVIGRPQDSATQQINVPGLGNFFSIPIKGTGNATDRDWNRLYVGQTVEIPLYYVVDDNGTVRQLGRNDAGMPDLSSDFKLRIRAHGGEELFPLPINASAYRHIEKDPVLVQWTISGTSTVGGQIVGRTLVARDDRDPSDTQKRKDEIFLDENTEISGGRINAARIAPHLNNLIVLEEDHKGSDISSRGNRESRAISIFLSQVNNPVLRLSLVGQPRRNTSTLDDFNPDSSIHINSSDFDIPYLEYQLLTNNPVSDSKQVVIGWAEFGGFRKEVRREIQREATLGGFVLEQF